MAVASKVEVRDKLYVDGEWVRPSEGRTNAVVNPATEDLIATVSEASLADVDRAVEAASRAFAAWAGTPRSERAEYLAAIAAGLQERLDEIATVITRELGMPYGLSRAIQARLPTEQFATMAEWMNEVRWEETVGNSRLLREPVGVVAAITPWNYPLHQAACKVAPALAAGCTVVLKPSTVAPLTSFLLAEVVDAADLPAGVFNLVTGRGTVVGEHVAAHPRIDFVSFTGSTAAGRRVSELAAANVKPCALELGGKSANVILDDADLERAVIDGVAKCFLNSGQTCSALTRMLIPREKLDCAEEIAASVAKTYVLGDPFERSTRMGPVVSEHQRKTVLAYIRGAVADGAVVVAGGSAPPVGLPRGFFVQPTVLSRVSNSMKVAQEEIFGPVLVLIPYDGDEDAVQIANDSPYGLAGAVWSGDEARAEQIARRLRTGQVEINGGAFNLAAPFGGFKQSGYGRENGSLAIEEFLQVKSLQF